MSTHLRYCGNCGSSKNLQSCNRCHCEVYCSKKCQREHWPTHKASVCDNVIKQQKGCRKMLSGDNPIDISYTHAGPAIMVNLGEMTLPSGVPRGLRQLRMAVMEMSCHILHKEYGESSYKAFYDEFMQEKNEWMEFFEHPENLFHVADAAAIIFELLAISCERKDSELFGEIVRPLLGIVDQWKEHISLDSAATCLMTDEQYQLSKKNSVFVTDQICSLQYELYMELGRYVELVQVFKTLCDIEISENRPIERQRFNNLWKTIRKLYGQHMQMPEELKPSFRRCDEAKRAEEIFSNHVLPDDVILKALVATTIHDVPDEMITTILKIENESIPLKVSQDRDLELKRCGHCSEQESACGDFKRCNRCKKVVYCSRNCQTSHWKKHKKECKASKK